MKNLGIDEKKNQYKKEKVIWYHIEGKHERRKETKDVERDACNSMGARTQFVLGGLFSPRKTTYRKKNYSNKSMLNINKLLWDPSHPFYTDDSCRMVYSKSNRRLWCMVANLSQQREIFLQYSTISHQH